MNRSSIKKYQLLFLLPVVFLFLGASLGFDKESPLKKFVPDHIQFENTEHDFGLLAFGKVYEYEFVGTNVSDQTIQIRKAFAGCPACVRVVAVQKEVKPGEKLNVKVFFNGGKRLGNHRKRIYIKTDIPNAYPFSLWVKAKVIDPNDPTSKEVPTKGNKNIASQIKVNNSNL